MRDINRTSAARGDELPPEGLFSVDVSRTPNAEPERAAGKTLESAKSLAAEHGTQKDGGAERNDSVRRPADMGNAQHQRRGLGADFDVDGNDGPDEQYD